MRALAHRVALAGVALASLGWVATVAAQTGSQGAINKSVPPTVSAKPVASLHLSDAQRNQIQQALRGENTEVTFGTKTTKPTESFNPTVGAKIPASLKPHTLPPPVLSQMPELKRYTYLKFKHQVLIVDPMRRKIVDMFPEA